MSSASTAAQEIDHDRAVQAAIFYDINPQSAIEWLLLAIDVAELWWEMQPYRLLRRRNLSLYRQKAVEMMLRRIEIAGVPSELRDLAKTYTTRNALDWQLDLSATAGIESQPPLLGLRSASPSRASSRSGQRAPLSS